MTARENEKPEGNERRDVASQRCYKRRRSVDVGKTRGKRKERRGIATVLQTEEECRCRRDKRETKGETRRHNGATNGGGVSRKERRAGSKGRDAASQWRYKRRRSVEEGETSGKRRERRGVATALQTKEECR